MRPGIPTYCSIKSFSALLAALLFAAGCGNSATTSVTEPALNRCGVTVNNGAQGMLPAGGGSGTLAVDTARECAWSARAESAWITLQGTLQGQGPATVQYTVAANPNGVARSGVVFVGDQRLEIGQEAAPCRYDASPSSHAVPATGGEISVVLTATAGCTWTARSESPWISGGTPANGQGGATVRFTVAASTGPARSGSVTVAGISIAVSQAAVGTPPAPTPAPTPAPPAPTPPAPAPPAPTPPAPTPPAPTPPAPTPPAPCTFAVSPTQETVAAGGETVVVAVRTQAGCAWTASSSAGWIDITAGKSGTGDGSARLVVAANTGAARSATVTIAGTAVTIQQQAAPPPAPAPCSYNISPSSRSVAAGGADVNVTVTAGDGCAWTASTEAGWITVDSGRNGSGDGTVRLKVAANSGPARSGTVTIAGKTFTVNQDAVACTYTISPVSRSIGRESTVTEVEVRAPAGCAWTTSSGADWITVGAGGTGDGSVRVTAAANTGDARSGTATIAGRTFTLQQEGAPAPCAYTLKPTSYHAGRGPDEIDVTVTTGNGCAWTSTSQANWITVAQGSTGSGSGAVRLLVQANTGAPRTGTVVIAGQTFTVQQDGPGCQNTIDPSSRQVGPGATDVNVGVQAAAGCTWTASSQVAWITVAEGASGTGPGTVRLAVAANTTGAPRTGTVAIAGQTFTVEQAALSCSYSIKPTYYDAGRGPDDIRVDVTADPGCAWTATTTATWVTIAEGSTGTGNGSVRLIIPANSGEARTATILIAGITFTLRQEGGGQ